MTPLTPTSEYRQDLLTGDWVLISPSRQNRPGSAVRSVAPTSGSAEQTDVPCVLCPSREGETPPEITRYHREGDRISDQWRLRVIPNKYPAVAPECISSRAVQAGLFRSIGGAGHHEVIVETPAHSRSLTETTAADLSDTLMAWRDRYEAIRLDERVAYILAFKNFGKAAGESLDHPHSQIIGTSVVPAAARIRTERAARYFEETGRHLFAELVRAEILSGQRVIARSEDICAIAPFASANPYEVWITSERPVASTLAAALTKPTLDRLGKLLREVLLRLNAILPSFSFNLELQTLSPDLPLANRVWWYLQVIPRSTALAGFELGSGMRINPVCPEATCKALKQIDAPTA